VNGCCRKSTLSTVWFGDCLESAGTIPTDKLFTGQRLDDTGLYYYGARYYDATIGRFISPDTFVQDYSNPQSLNRYSYCSNNPLKYTDPTGHFLNFIIGAIIGAATYAITTAVVNAATGHEWNYGWNWGEFGASVGIGALTVGIASLETNVAKAGITASTRLATEGAEQVATQEAKRKKLPRTRGRHIGTLLRGNSKKYLKLGKSQT
jgi:RHS repeat-associated protein